MTGVTRSSSSDERTGEYLMLLAARRGDGPENRRGCIAVAASADLEHWEIREPFWSPDLYYTHECPDLFRVGDEWCLRLLHLQRADRDPPSPQRVRSTARGWLDGRRCLRHASVLRRQVGHGRRRAGSSSDGSRRASASRTTVVAMGRQPRRPRDRGCATAASPSVRRGPSSTDSPRRSTSHRSRGSADGRVDARRWTADRPDGFSYLQAGVDAGAVFDRSRRSRSRPGRDRRAWSFAPTSRSTTTTRSASSLRVARRLRPLAASWRRAVHLREAAAGRWRRDVPAPDPRRWQLRRRVHRRSGGVQLPRLWRFATRSSGCS